MQFDLEKIILGVSTSSASEPSTFSIEKLQEAMRLLDSTLLKREEEIYFFRSKKGEIVLIERVINLRTATEEQINDVFKYHADLGIDLTGASIISIPRYAFLLPEIKFDWSKL